MTNEKLVPKIADSNGVLSAVKKKKEAAKATVFDAFSRAFAKQNSQFESGNVLMVTVLMYFGDGYKLVISLIVITIIVNNGIVQVSACCSRYNSATLPGRMTHKYHRQHLYNNTILSLSCSSPLHLI